MTKKPNKADKDYEKLGRMLVDIYETGFSDRKKFLKLSFTRGLVTGFGGVLGGTILIALLLWLLSLLGEIPFIGKVFENVRSAVDNTR